MDHFRSHLGPVEAGKDPWVAYRGATDHDCLTASVALHALDIIDRFHVPISDDRDLDGCFHLGNGIPVGLSAVHLLFRPSMDGNGGAAILFNDAGN